MLYRAEQKNRYITILRNKDNETVEVFTSAYTKNPYMIPFRREAEFKLLKILEKEYH